MGSRGQVGIGTLIVFIAMVLVAAVAGSVLVNSAGDLRDSGMEVSKDGVGQVTDRVNVLSVRGKVDVIDSKRVLTGLDIIVTPGPGANNVNMSSMTVLWVGSGGASQMGYQGRGNNTGYSFGSKAVLDSDFSEPVLNDDSDVVIIQLREGNRSSEGIASGFKGGLNPGETGTVLITTGSGGQTRVDISVPESLLGKSAVSL